MITSSIPATDKILRPPNTSSIPSQPPNLTRKLAREAISPQLKQLKSRPRPHIQLHRHPPALVVRPFTIRTLTHQLIVNKPLAPTLTTDQAMGKQLIGPQLTESLQDDGEGAHLVNGFPATCRIDHSMFSDGKRKQPIELHI